MKLFNIRKWQLQQTLSKGEDLSPRQRRWLENDPELDEFLRNDIAMEKQLRREAHAEMSRCPRDLHRNIMFAVREDAMERETLSAKGFADRFGTWMMAFSALGALAMVATSFLLVFNLNGESPAKPTAPGHEGAANYGGHPDLLPMGGVPTPKVHPASFSRVASSEAYSQLIPDEEMKDPLSEELGNLKEDARRTVRFLVSTASFIQ